VSRLYATRHQTLVASKPSVSISYTSFISFSF
jgi:hypothetical protein